MHIYAEWIYGFSVGVEYVNDDIDKYVVIDLFILRVLFEF